MHPAQASTRAVLLSRPAHTRDEAAGAPIPRLGADDATQRDAHSPAPNSPTHQRAATRSRNASEYMTARRDTPKQPEDASQPSNARSRSNRSDVPISPISHGDDPDIQPGSRAISSDMMREIRQVQGSRVWAGIMSGVSCDTHASVYADGRRVSGRHWRGRQRRFWPT